MPRKSDPLIVKVLAYFETAPFDAAEIGGHLVKAIIDRRRPKVRAPKPATASIEMPSPQRPPPEVKGQRARRRQGAAARSTTEEVDVPLPGLAPSLPVVGG